jgi:hypothetical protein
MGDVRQRTPCDDEVGDLRLKAAAAAAKIYIECSFHIQIVHRLSRPSFLCLSPLPVIHFAIEVS